jgi:hypothetical protein
MRMATDTARGLTGEHVTNSPASRGTSIAPIDDDIMVKWSSYCLSASHYVRWALGQFARSPNRRANGGAIRSLETCLPETNAGTGCAEVIRDDDAKISRLQIEQRLIAGETIVLENFPLETVAALCDRHNYRWTFCDRPNGKASLRFVLRPGPKVIQNSSSRGA